jgi:hypothetical protein
LSTVARPVATCAPKGANDGGALMLTYDASYPGALKSGLVME